VIMQRLKVYATETGGRVRGGECEESEESAGSDSKFKVNLTLTSCLLI